MIHFQHDQEGATLRASEVKPKLDKYILTKLGDENYDLISDDEFEEVATSFESSPQNKDKILFDDLSQKSQAFEVGKYVAKKKGWLSGKGEHNALNYKMKIEATETEVWDINELKPYTDRHKNAQKKIIKIDDNEYLAKIRKSDGKLIPDLTSYPLFFANLDADYRIPDEYKKFSFAKEPILMTLVFPSTSLFDLFNQQDLLNDFFFQTNFGTRQSKGFGSFLPLEASSEKYNKAHVEFDLNIKDGEFGTKKVFDRLFYSIDLFYKTLRSGINQKIGREKEQGIYFKSLMYYYAIQNNSYWDKRTIRYKFNHFTPNINRDKGEESDMKNDGNNKEDIARLYRDMLGLSSLQAWMSYNNDVITKEHVTNDSDKQIARFKSPILIKPIHKKDGSFRIMLIPFPIPEEYKNAEFNISSRNCGNSCDFSMKTPKDFQTSNFIKFIYDRRKELVLDTLKEFANHKIWVVKNDARILISIFNNIRFVERKF